MVTKPGKPRVLPEFQRLSACYCELIDTALAASPEITVHAEALSVLFKQLYRSLFISINFPDSCVFGVFAFVLYKALYVLKRITQKNADLVRETHLIRLFIGQAAHEVIKTAPDTALG